MLVEKTSFDNIGMLQLSFIEKLTNSLRKNLHRF